MCKKYYFDGGNSNYKGILEDKRYIGCSNVEEVSEGSLGAYQVDGKNYIFGEVAQSKRTTNKIVDEKRALLGYALYPVVENGEKLEVSTLLPLSLYVNVENRKRYEELLKGRYTIVNPNGVKKSFTVQKVEVMCESFSSLMVSPKLLNEPIFLVDFGGVDLSGVYVNGTPDISKSFTVEKGTNILYRDLAKVITAHTRETYTDKEVKLLLDKYDALDEDLKKVIDGFITDYIQKNIYNNLKDIGYKPLLHKIVATGGGSQLVRRYLEQDSNITILDDSIWSNVEGCKIISVRRGGK